MLGNLLGMNEYKEKKRLLSNTTALQVLGIFFKDWYSLREASMIYNPDMPKYKRNERVVAYYFYKFNKLGWLEEKRVKKLVKRKKSIYPYYALRYRLNYNPFFFEYYEHAITIEKRLNSIKKKLLPFLNKEKTRQEIIKNCSHEVFILSEIKNKVDKRFNTIY